MMADEYREPKSVVGGQIMSHFFKEESRVG